MLEELCDVMSGEDKEQNFKDMLKKMVTTMSDRSSVNRNLAAYKEEELAIDVHTHFLYCNAHFLLGLSNACSSVLKTLESELENGTGLRRDAREI